MRLVEPLADRLSVHFARFPVTAIADEPASHRQFAIASIVGAAQLLADARVDGLLWAGTSAAWQGLQADEQLVAAIHDATGRPATTATLSLLAAFRALDVRRYGLVVPYVEPIVEAIVRTLGSTGYECVAREYDSLTVNWEFGSVSAASIAAHVRSVAGARPDAIVIHCTNLRGAEVSEGLERELGIPVLDSVVVGLWGALQMLEIATPQVGFGSLASAAGAQGQRARGGP